jgi:hypothetical protein
MASLAVMASLVILLTVLCGPMTYLLARLYFPAFIIYILSILSILAGINFCLIGIPVWYLGLIPIYFGYISILRVRQNKLKLDKSDSR